MQEKHNIPSINLRKEIAREYRLAKYKWHQIDIMCDEYLLSDTEIKEILINEGEKLPEHSRIAGYWS